MSRNLEGKLGERLKDKTLALFFTTGISLKTWHDMGLIDREVTLYNEMSKYFGHIYFFTYGDEKDLEFKSYLADNITIVPKKYISINLLYSFLMLFIHYKILKDVDILKTNQMWGSWSAVFAKLVYRKKLVVRTGFMLSINFAKKNPKSLKIWIIKLVEMISYKLGDGIITSPQSNFDYVERNYNPKGVHILIPNYVETEIFKPMDNVKKKKDSVCFVGRLTNEKNLFALLEALKNLAYPLTIIGSGEQQNGLNNFANENGVNVNFLGTVPNRELPIILNKHELFIMPSFYENMPKALLEAMACGLPVIGTNVKGINEVVDHGKNGMLCDINSVSIRKAVITLMDDDELKQKLGENARRTIVENYSLDNLARKELKFMAELV